MEIGLINTGKAFYIENKSTESEDSVEHLGQAYIAAVLRENGFNVTLMHVESDEELIQYIKQKEPSVLGFTTTSSTMLPIIALTELAKRVNSNIITVYGGHMATFCPDRILDNCSSVDYLIRGEGEYSFLEFCKKVEAKGDILDSRGLSYRKNGKNVHNELFELIANLDELPFPVRHIHEIEQKKYSFLRISGSRGCYGNCAFCSSFVSREKKPRWRGRSPRNIIDEMEYLINKYSVQSFDIVDASFEDPPIGGKERLEMFANEILQRNMKVYFNCNFRAEGWKEEDIKVIEKLEDAGLEKVFIGIESGVENTLRLFQKRATTEDNLKIISLLKNRRRLNVTFGFIMFHPYNTFDELKENAYFLHKTGVSYDIRNYFTKLEVYPQTIIRNKMIKDRLIDEKDDFSETFDYRFVDDKVRLFADRVHSFLEVDAIFQYINIDMRFYSVLSRIYRIKDRLNEIQLARLDSIYDILMSVRAQLVDFNYHFFIWLIDEFLMTGTIDTESAKKNLSSFLDEKMAFIRVEELKFLRRLYPVIKEYL